MIILLGLLLWFAAGTFGALIARGVRPRTGGRETLAVAWGIFGGFLGGLIGLIPSLPRHADLLRPGALAGAVAGGLLLSLAYRLLRRRSQPATRRWPAISGLVLLAVGSLALAGATWFLLAVVNPRLYHPGYNAAVEPALTRSCAPSAPLARSCLSEMVRVYLARPENAGIVIGVWVDSARVLVSGGVTSKASGVPMDVSNLFEVGSVTKVFTGLALAQAVAAGELRLDEKVANLLPADGPELRGLPITLEDLATHYSGLRDRPPALPWAGLVHDNPFLRLSESDVVASVAASARQLPAKRRYAYSNLDYTLLGDVLARAGRVPLRELLAQRVFQPLGMTRTLLPADTAAPLGLVDGHSLGQRMPHWIGQDLAGAVGAVSCADDLLKLIEAEIRLQPEALRPALTLASTGRRKGGPGHDVALGWVIRIDSAGHRFVHHSGRTPGFVAYVGYSADAPLGVVVLGNSNDPTVDAIGSRLLDVLRAHLPVRTPGGAFTIGAAGS